MEDQTQAILDDEAEEQAEQENPLGYVRVLSQKDLEQTDYPIQEGEVTLGRGSECELVIEARSLSRKHATVLVEGGTHFIQDLNSRNKTYRGTVQLRPNAFYELTNGCKLTFADIKCIYYIGSLPEEEEEEGGEAAVNEEATQAYGVDEEDSDETDDDDVNAEPTQAYHFDGAAAEEEEGEEEGAEPMDCDATVAYNIEADGDKESDNEDSPPSSPILVVTKQLHPKEDTSKDENSSSSGAKKPSKKVCFAAGTAPRSAEGAAATSKASASKEKGDDETDGEETDGEESTQPYEEGEEKAGTEKDKAKEGESEGGGEGRTTTPPALKETETVGGSVMDIDECDPTVAYDLETDEENTDTEEGSKDDRKAEEKEGAAGGAEPTVPYNLKEEDEDSDKTDVEEEGSGSVPEASKVIKEESGAKAEDGAAAKVPTEEQSEETEDGGDTEKVESSATEPESQEVKEKPDHLRPPPRVAQNAKTLSGVSLMDCVEQGGGTVLLESYESSCDETVPLHPTPTVTTVDKESTMATVAMETAAAKEGEGSLEGKEEPQPAAQPDVVKKEESDDSDGLIPELPGLGSKGVGGSRHSRQKTLFAAVSAQRGRGRGSRRGQGRKATATRKGATKTEEPLGEGETEDKKEAENESRDAKEATLTLKTEEDTNKKNKATTASDISKSELKQLDSIGGISGKVAILRLNTLSLATSATASDGNNVDGTSNEAPAPSEGAEVKVKGSKRGRGRGRKRTASRQTSRAGIGRSRTITEITSAATVAADTADLLQEEESPDLPFLSKEKDQSDHTKKSHDHEEDANDQSDHSVSTTSTASLESSRSGRGRKGKGRGGASKRGKAATTPRRKSTENAPKTRTPSSTPSLRHHRTPSSASRAVSSTPGEKPRIMFTGLIDKDGEKTIRELGGELVDSVYQCTHLITDKVRRTVKFLCCLSRGCLIVSDAWLDQCALEKRFLPAEPYLIKDKPAERQHKFTLQRSHVSAKVTKVLANYKVYLTPNVKPEREHMSDIIKCSGGEVLDFGVSFSPGEKVIVIACEEDLGMCKDAMESGVPVHSTELILGGVLRQELELHDHLMTAPSSSASVTSRKRRAKESSLIPAAKRKRK